MSSWFWIFIIFGSSNYGCLMISTWLLISRIFSSIKSFLELTNSFSFSFSYLSCSSISLLFCFYTVISLSTYYCWKGLVRVRSCFNFWFWLGFRQSRTYGDSKMLTLGKESFFSQLILRKAFSVISLWSWRAWLKND